MNPAIEFFRRLANEFFNDERGELDYSDFADLAVETGCLEKVPFDPKKHAHLDLEDVETGDEIYIYSEDLLALLDEHIREREAQAQRRENNGTGDVKGSSDA